MSRHAGSSLSRPIEKLLSLADGTAAFLSAAQPLATAVLVAWAALLLLVGVLRALGIAGWESLSLSLAVSLFLGALFFARCAPPQKSLAHPSWRLIALLLLVLLVLLPLLYHLLPDTSYDSVNYHFPAILQLAEGWNPTWEKGDLIWADRYPSGTWTLFAAFSAPYDSLYVGRALKWLLLLTGLVATFGFLAELIRCPRHNLLISITIVASPICSGQIWTYYNDDVIYILTLMSFFAAAGYLRRATSDRAVLLFACGLLLCLTKIYGLYYFLFACLAAVVFVWPIEHSKIVSAKHARLGGAFLAALLLCGWRPFVTNTLLVGDPFLIGYDNPGQQVGQQPPSNLAGLFHPLRFFAAMIAQSGGWDGEPAHFKLPFWVVPREIYFMGTPDLRVGGFGPFYLTSLLIAAALTLFLWARCGWSLRDERVLKVAGIGLVIVIAVTAFPFNWVARHVPIGWLLPLVPVICLCAASPSLQVAAGRWARSAAYAICFLSLVSSGLAFVGNGARNVLGWRQFQSEIAQHFDAGETIGILPLYREGQHISVGYWLQLVGRRVVFIDLQECAEERWVYRRVELCRVVERP